MFRTWSRCYHNHVLPRKAGDSSIMSQRCSETLWIFNDAMPKIVNIPLTLILGGSTDIVCSIFAHKGRQYYDYG